MAEYGMVVDVTLGDPDGTEAVVAASAGDASLTVDYASDWSVPRRVRVNETTVKVTAITEGAGEGDPDVLTLAAPLDVDVAVGDLVVPLVGGEPVLTWEVHVDLGDGHPVDVPIPFEMRPMWETFSPRDPWPIVLSDDLERILEVPGRRPVIDPSYVDLLFEHAEPAYTPTSGELASGSFTHQLLHRNIAAEHGLFTTINGVAIGSEWWSLDADSGVITVTIPPWVADAPAERREFGWPMYTYRRGLAVETSEVTVPEPVEVSYVGSTAVASPAGSVAFPAGVLAGDLAVAVAMARTTGNPRIDDTRFATRSYTLDGGNTIVIGTWVVNVDSPSAVDLTAPDLGGVQDGVGMLYVVRPAAPIGFLDPPTDSGVQSVGAPFSIPGFANASGSIVILCTLGGISGAYGWGLSGADVATTPSSYGLIYASFMDERPTVSAATATPGNGSYARGFQVGLGLA